MKIRVHPSVFLTIFFVSMSLNAKQDASDNHVHSHYQPSLSEVIETSNSRRAYQRRRNTSLFYLVSESSTFSGDTLSLSGRRFETSRDGVDSSGLYFNFGNLLLLWDRSSSTYQFVGISAFGDRVWKSCWAQNQASARTCDSTSELIYIFSDERAALAFQNEEDDNIEEPIAMAPDQTEEPNSNPEKPDAAENTDTQETPPAEDTTDSPPETEPTQEAQPSDPPAQPVDEQSQPSSQPSQAEPSDDTDSGNPQPTANFADISCGAAPEDFKSAILQATNQSRSQGRSCGVEAYTSVPALTWNASLASAAKSHSDDMASNNFFSHSGSDGLQVWNRANAEGYEYRYIGENIAAGQRSVGEVQKGWIDSPGHCANIMNTSIVEMGAACVVDSDSDYRTYWTVVVGQPR